MIELDNCELSPLEDKPLVSTAEFGAFRHEVPGLILEGAWQLDDEILLATTNDIPFEETLHFTLLNKNGVEETVSLEAMYTTGTFRFIDSEERAIRFAFFGETDWTVTVLEKAVRHWPFFSDPRGVSRVWCFRKRLLVNTL